MTQEKAVERNHSLKITSRRAGQGKDIDDVGSFVLKNGITKKEHAITMWGEGIEEDSLITIALYTNEPEEIIRLTGEDMSFDGAASDALIDYSLDDLIKNEEDFWPDIEKYGLEKTEHYEHDVALEDIKADLHELIVKEEITDLIIKMEKDDLTKEDVLDFGKLVKGDNTRYNLGTEFKAPIQKILSENSFDAREIDFISNASKTLKADVDFRSLVASKEEFSNMKLPVAIEPTEKAYPKEFLEKFQELNAIEPKLLLHEDRKAGLIAMGVLVEREVPDSGDRYEFIQLSNIEMSSFDYSSAINEKMKESKELGSLHIDSLDTRSQWMSSDRNALTDSNIPLDEAKEFVLENAQDTYIEPNKLEEFAQSKGVDDLYGEAYGYDADWYQLNYDLGSEDKYIKVEKKGEPVDYTPSYDLNGEELWSKYYDYVPENEVTYYELDERNLTFIDGETNEEYPLDKILSKDQLQKFKESVDARESIKINLTSRSAETIEDLTKDRDKTLSTNRLLNNSKEEIEHSR